MKRTPVLPLSPKTWTGLSRLWRPDPEVYFRAYDGSIRRFDVRNAGGRRAHRKLKREKRRRRVAELKAREVRR